MTVLIFNYVHIRGEGRVDHCHERTAGHFFFSAVSGEDWSVGLQAVEPKRSHSQEQQFLPAWDHWDFVSAVSIVRRSGGRLIYFYYGSLKVLLGCG